MNSGMALPVYNAMRKHSHYTEIWADEIDDRELLYQLEIQTIAQLKEYGIELYNLTDGGDGQRGWVPSEEWRKNNSLIRKGTKLSEETKKKMSVSQKLVWTNEHREKMKKIRTGKKMSEETKLKIGNANRGRIPTEEHKRKLSDSKIGKYRGKNCWNSKPKEYYAETPSIRGNFKRVCNRQGWNFSDFEEVDSGERYKTQRKFYYILKESA